MAIKTVGMISSYQNLDKRCDWLWQQTPHQFGVWGNIQMQALVPKPDFLLMYQFDFPQPTQEKSWLNSFRKQQQKSELNIDSLLRGVSKEQGIYLLREPPLDEVVERNKQNYQQAQKYCSYVSGPDDFAPTPDYMPAIWYHSNSFRELNEMPPPKRLHLAVGLPLELAAQLTIANDYSFCNPYKPVELSLICTGAAYLHGRQHHESWATNGTAWHPIITIWRLKTMPTIIGMSVKNFGMQFLHGVCQFTMVDQLLINYCHQEVFCGYPAWMKKALPTYKR
jgi:hypothetical protein